MATSEEVEIVKQLRSRAKHMVREAEALNRLAARLEDTVGTANTPNTEAMDHEQQDEGH